MPKHVFLSYSRGDTNLATIVCEALERHGVACWVAPRDIPPGAAFDKELIKAIAGASVFVLLLSAKANDSPFVQNEVNRASSKGKPILTFRIEDVIPGESLELYLGRYQWVDGFIPPLEKKIDLLADAILRLLGREPGKPPLPEEGPVKPPVGDLRRHLRAAAYTAIFVAVASVLAWFGYLKPHPSLKLAPEVTDEAGRPINRTEAPFKIRVKGTATGVDRSYVYLVVDDSNAQWIEPTGGLGPNVGREFSGYCYLGEKEAGESIGKQYKIFAVATNREYSEYEKLDRRTLQAESSIIELLRVR